MVFDENRSNSSFMIEVTMMHHMLYLNHALSHENISINQQLQ